MKIKILCALFAALPLCAQGLPEEAAALAKPDIGQQVQLPKSVNLGALQFNLSDGAKAWQIVAAGQPCGIIVEDAATFTYHTTDKFGIPLARRNVKGAVKGADVNITDTGNLFQLRGSVSRFVIWTWEYGGIPPIAGGEAPGKDLRDWLADVSQNGTSYAPGNELLNAKYNRVRGVVLAIFKGKGNTFQYLRDPIKSMEQSLVLMEKIKRGSFASKNLWGKWAGYNMISEPVGRKWWDRFPAALVSTREKIEIDNKDGEFTEITTWATLKATMDNVSMWRVNLRSQVNFKDNPRKILVNRVLVDGKEANFNHRDHELFVHLGKTLKQGEETTVEVVTSGELAFRPAGDKFWSLGTFPWYPQPDLNGEFAHLEIILRVPKPFTPFASGNKVSLEESDTHVTLHTKLERPMQFPVVAAGEYKLATAEQDGLRCNVATYIFDRKKSAERLQNNFFASAKFYNLLFGTPYPFEEFTIIERNTYGFGQAPPGIIFMTKEAFESRQDTMSQLTSQGVNSRYVHEVAHAWWGHVVKMDSLNEQWLTESFADYSAALCMEKMYGGKRGKAEFKKILKEWKANADRVRAGGSIYLANYLSFYPGNGDRRDRTYLLYNKGPFVLHALRLELQEKHGEKAGDDMFYTLLRSFVTNFKFRWGATRHFVGILNQISGDDWQPWFEKYVYGSEMPEI